MKLFLFFAIIPLFCFSNLHVIHYRNDASDKEIEVWRRIYPVKDVLSTQCGNYIFVFDNENPIKK